jgi:glycosyltransferase involved in cell wall biosynthesis
MAQQTRKPKLLMAVTNDLVSDNRVHKIASTLTQMGFDVTLAGRKLKASPDIAYRPYRTRRFKLWINKGPLFYANYNIRLFFYLLFNKYEVINANDLDSLWACYAASKITKAHLVYDSHEYFTEVPELVDRPKVKRIWERIEARILPKLKNCYTVCESIANIYNKKYGCDFKVVRNLPMKTAYADIDKDYRPPFPSDLPVVLYQGAVNKGRGIEEAIVAMHHIDNARLVIIGNGDLYDKCKQLATDEKLTDKVFFTGRVPFQQLAKMTRYAAVGLSLEKDIGLNYRYALPNKLFDYIHSHVPVIASSLPEIKRVVETYKTGISIEETTPIQVSNAINYLLRNKNLIEEIKSNCQKAKAELNWENEEKTIKKLYNKLL